MRQLSKRDSSLLHSNVQHGNVSSTGVYLYDPSTAPEGEVSYEGILEHLERRLHTSPVFRRRLVEVPLDLDQPYWIEDEDFELEDHVRHVALPKPGDWQQFCTLAARIHARPLDLSRPLWEIYVVEGLDNVDGLPKGSFALLTKIHHAATGGRSGTEIMAGLHDTSPDATTTRASYTQWISEDEPSMLELLFRTYYNFATTPLRALEPGKRIISSLTPASVNFYTGLLAQRERIPLTRFNREVSSRRVWQSCYFNLTDVQTIKRAVDGTTIHDVVLAVCSGALRQYLFKKGELPSGGLNGLVPIILDPTKNSQSSEEPVSFINQELYTQLDHSIDRLVAIAKDNKDSRLMKRAIKTRDLIDADKHAPSETIALASRILTIKMAKNASSPPLAHCSITNVPGPQTPLYLGGAKLTYISGLAPLSDGLGLAFVVNSYNGKLVISPTSCREILPDAGEFEQCIELSFKELLTAAQREAAGEPRLAPMSGGQKESAPPVLADSGADNAQRNNKPSLIHSLLEGRAALEIASIPLALPFLSLAPKGDGHPVMILPGFSADDSSTMFLRLFLKKCGYAVHSWGFNRNIGLAGNIEERVVSRVRKLEMRSGQKVSLVGHSLGGLISRHVAHDIPESIRQVITLGSPLGMDPGTGNISDMVSKLYGLANPETVISDSWLHMTQSRTDKWRSSPPVPLTAVYSRSDGAVHWSSCLDPLEHENTENVKVPGSHIGLPNNPMALWVLANRLSQPEGKWKPMQKNWAHNVSNVLLDPLGYLP